MRGQERIPLHDHSDRNSGGVINPAVIGAVVSTGGAASAGTFVEPGGATPVDHGAMGATETIDVGDGTWHRGTLTANCTITVQGFTLDEGVVALVKLSQDGTGGWDVTWDGDVTFIGGDDQPNQGASDETWYELWSDQGDTIIQGVKIGGAPEFATPSIVLGSVAAAGSALTVIRSDATIVAFDTTDPETLAFDEVADPGDSAFAARRDHVHGMPASTDGLLTVDPGTPTYNDSGADVVVTYASKWGYDGSGPYYNSAGVTAGDEAILALDPTDGALVLVPYIP